MLSSVRSPAWTVHRGLKHGPIDSQNLERATVIPMDQMKYLGSWHVTNLPDASGEIARSLPTVWVGAHPGDAVMFSVKGNLIGIYGIKGPDVGDFSVKIDNGKPETKTFFDPYSTAGRYRIRTWFSNRLPSTIHTVRIEVLRGSPDKARNLVGMGPQWSRHRYMTALLSISVRCL